MKKLISNLNYKKYKKGKNKKVQKVLINIG